MFEHLDRLLQTSPDGALASAAINTFTSRGGKQVDRSEMFPPVDTAQAKPLALESSNCSNVPLARIQHAPCSTAPVRNGLQRPGTSGGTSPQNRWGSSSGYGASPSRTDLGEISVVRNGCWSRQACGASTQMRRYVAPVVSSQGMNPSNVHQLEDDYWL
jgi:hypothetical protein